MLEKNAMLVNLTISSWLGEVRDMKVSDEVAKRAGADCQSGHYLKKLFPKAALVDVKKATTAARQLNYTLTMPWDDSGWRLLPVSVHSEYVKSMDAAFEARLKAKQEFIKNYYHYQKEAHHMLGGLYNGNDYPSVEEINDKISSRYKFMPVPAAGNFIADVSQEHTVLIKHEIEKNIQAQITGAIESLFMRLKENIEMSIERVDKRDLFGDPVHFKDTVVTNLRDIAKIVPKLNVTKDGKLTELCDSLSRVIDGISPDMLRPSKPNYDSVKKDKFKLGLERIVENEKFDEYFKRN